MTRNAAFIRDNLNATGDCDWIDISNNWRDADATWLQERSIVRVGTTPDAEADLANTHEGRVFYSTTNKVLYVSTTGTAPFFRLLASTSLVVDESVPQVVRLGVSEHLNQGIVFDTGNGNVTIGNLTVAALGGVTALTVLGLSAGEVAVTGAGFTIETDGAHQVILTTGTDGLLVSTGMDVGGPISSPSGAFGFLSADGPTALGVTTIASTLSVATSIATPEITSLASGDLTVAVQPGRSVRFTAPTIGDANFFYDATAARLAWVIVDSVDPGVTGVPEGTIWIQP